MFDFKINESGDVGLLRLSGEININMAVEFKKILLDAMGSVREVLVDVENVTDADLTCFQLLCSAHRTFLKINKKLILTGKIPEFFTENLKRSGYTKKICCGPSEIDCIWIGGNKKWAN
jgi:anti-anti-sigma factor